MFGGSMFGRDPFGGSMFGRSPFGGMLRGSMFPAIEDMAGPNSSTSRVYSSATQTVGSNGQWVSRSQMTRTINGRTETITKRVDANVGLARCPSTSGRMLTSSVTAGK